MDFISHNGMSVACLHGKVVGNTFRNQTGSPLMDFGPGATNKHLIWDGLKSGPQVVRIFQAC